MTRRALLLAAVLLTACRPAPIQPPTAPTAVCIPVRDVHGRIARSEAVRHAFMRQTGYPHGRPRYIIDHIIPLACCGLDDVSNLQWQTIAEAKAKDRIERRGCGQ